MFRGLGVMNFLHVELVYTSFYSSSSRLRVGLGTAVWCSLVRYLILGCSCLLGTDLTHVAFLLFCISALAQ